MGVYVTDVAARSLGDQRSAPWWRDAVGYEVYLRSFCDSDGDGIGDLTGLRSRLDHLERLGVDVVWVTPFYPSPMADFGYDVADYRDVDPRFGTLADVDGLIDDVHRRGMRIIVDLVPNHTSDQHRWFRASRSSRDDPLRDHYVWRDPAPDGGPPNNWVSHFGGPAWTLDETTGQYYLHLFLPEQPDLNWADADVRADFLDVLRFWLDRRVDGFRIDVAHALTKDPELRDNPILAELPEDASPRHVFDAMAHEHDLDQFDNVEIYREWHEVTGPRGAVLLGEVYLDAAPEVARYVEGDGLDLSFYFPVLHAEWDPAALRTVIGDALGHGGGRFCWVHSSHDDHRAPSRFGGGDLGRRRALSFIALTAFLPGPLFLYQGDELGLVDGLVPDDAAADPLAVRNVDHSDGRDPVRTPIPWTPDRPNLGFSDGTPWLPMARNHDATDCVDAQDADPASPLNVVRRLLHLRQELLPLPTAVDPLPASADVLAYRRGPVVVALNAGDAAHEVDVPPACRVRFEHGGATLGGRLLLPPASMAVLAP